MTLRHPGDLPTASETIVIQYGSRNLKVGMARDALPRTIPHVIAHRGLHCPAMRMEAEEGCTIQEEQLQERLTQRYRQAKKKPPPNIYQSILGHNETVRPQTISALNDAYGFEWARTGDKVNFCVGKEALRINPVEPFALRWPIVRGKFNQLQYSSYREILDDLDRIWGWAIQHELKIPRREFCNYGLVVVVPDSIQRWEVKALMELALRLMSFKTAAFLIESVAGTFGAGLSSACVIDMGAQCTRVCLVEEGQIQKNSQSILSFGGDDLTRLLTQILRLHSFPYTECCLERILDWELMDELKVRMCTMDEDDLASLVYEAYVRCPGEATRVYPFKVFEERLIVPSALFEEGVPLLRHMPATTPATAASATFYTAQSDFDQLYYAAENKMQNDATERGSADELEFNPNPTSQMDLDLAFEGDSRATDTNHSPLISLPDAIFKALDSVDAASSPERLKKLLSSILVIGRGLQFPRMLAHLESVIRQRYPEYEVELVLGGGLGTIPSAKENLVLDAGIVAWKGGAVFAKLDCIHDLWISQRDLDGLGIRAMRERLTFIPL